MAILIANYHCFYLGTALESDEFSIYKLSVDSIRW